MKQTKTRKKRTPQEEPSMASLFSNLKYSLPATLGVFLLLTLVVSLILYFLEDPAPFIRPLALLSSAAAALIGGWILCKKQGGAALLCGLVNGCFFLCILAQSSGYSPLLSAALHLGVLFCSILGGYAGLPRQKRKKR